MSILITVFVIWAILAIFNIGALRVAKYYYGDSIKRYNSSCPDMLEGDGADYAVAVFIAPIYSLILAVVLIYRAFKLLNTNPLTNPLDRPFRVIAEKLKARVNR